MPLIQAAKQAYTETFTEVDTSPKYIPDSLDKGFNYFSTDTPEEVNPQHNTIRNLMNRKRDSNYKNTLFISRSQAGEFDVNTGETEDKSLAFAAKHFKVPLWEFMRSLITLLNRDSQKGETASGLLGPMPNQRPQELEQILVFEDTTHCKEGRYYNQKGNCSSKFSYRMGHTLPTTVETFKTGDVRKLLLENYSGRFKAISGARDVVNERVYNAQISRLYKQAEKLAKGDKAALFKYMSILLTSDFDTTGGADAVAAEINKHLNDPRANNLMRQLRLMGVTH